MVSDSFWVTWQPADPNEDAQVTKNVQFRWAVVNGPVWHWVRINQWLDAGRFDREWKFKEKGETVLRIAVREDAAMLDAIFVTPNWYLKHHQGLEYLNMAMAQVTDNPAMADGSSIHHNAKQQLHEYIQPLMRAGKQASWDDLLLQINRRKPKLVQQIGTQQVQNILQQVIDFSQ